MKRIRILLVEDNRVLREGVTAVVKAQPDMSVVGATDGSANTLRMAMALEPHILLKDLGVRNRNGLEIVKSFREKLPEVKVIGMGLIPSQLDIVEFVSAGAAGFILKDAKVAEFLSTIRAVALGANILPPTLTGSLFSHVIEHALKRGNGSAGNAVRMTKRERETVALIADGLSNKEIATQLNIATYTVKSHVHNILEKLALHSRLQIATQAHPDGSLEPG